MSRQCEAKSHAFCPISGKSRATFCGKSCFQSASAVANIPYLQQRAKRRIERLYYCASFLQHVTVTIYGNV